MKSIILKSITIMFLCVVTLSFMCITIIQPTLLPSEVDANPLSIFNNINDTLFYVSYIFIVLALIVLIVWHLIQVSKLKL